jgi:hypothetical protein
MLNGIVSYPGSQSASGSCQSKKISDEDRLHIIDMSHVEALLSIVS